MSFSLDRRIEVLGAFARQNRLNVIKIKISILDLLREHGCLHLSGLKDYLKEKKGIDLAIGTLHKYVKQMSDAGILRVEKGKNPQRLYIYIADLTATEWLFQDMPRERVDPDVIANILRYVNETKKKWNDVEIRARNKIMTLKEYAPHIVSKLTISGLEQFKQIVLLNRVEQKICRKATLPELEELVEMELKQTESVSYESYKKLRTDFELINQFKKAFEKYFPKEGFTLEVFDEEYDEQANNSKVLVKEKKRM
jgi:hypothetical protein